MNTKIDSKKISVADAQINYFYYNRGELKVFLQSDSKAIEIIFHTVLAIKVFSPEGQDLSHLSEVNNSDYAMEICNISDEKINDFKEFKFISAWSDESLLTIIANNYNINNTLSS